MAVFSQVPINQTSLSGVFTSLTLGSGSLDITNVNFIQFLGDGSTYPLSSLNVPASGSTGGGSGVIFPTIGQLYPYY
jgi:hypothetical protein